MGIINKVSLTRKTSRKLLCKVVSNVKRDTEQFSVTVLEGKAVNKETVTGLSGSDVSSPELSLYGHLKLSCMTVYSFSTFNV